MRKSHLLLTGLRAAGATALRRAWLRAMPGRTLTILAYHRVLPGVPADFCFDREVVSCTPAEFERELAFVRRHFDVVSFRDLVGHGLNGHRNPLIITFDDGYKDNHDVVLPILLKHGVKATFFVSTGYVDTDRLPWWDEINALIRCGGQDAGHLDHPSLGRLSLASDAERARAVSAFVHAAKTSTNAARLAMLSRLREQCGALSASHGGPLFMSWADIRHLAAENMELGSHTVTHPLLDKLEDDEMLRAELRESKAQLERHTGQPIHAFAYPVGSPAGVSARIVQALKDEGYRCACTYAHGVNPRTSFDPFRLRRIQAEVGDAFRRFEGKLLFPGWIRY
ncbi:MAG: polysaccharide deacetylase family protein [Kiritimatiellae bacterium]|nr:polysaccharide deacetylase family protein [Kiritimatiellia bacterium]